MMTLIGRSFKVSSFGNPMYIFSRDHAQTFCNYLFKTRLHLFILAIVLVLFNISNYRLFSVSLSFCHHLRESRIIPRGF